MSQEHQQLLSDLQFAIAAELARLHELAEDLGEIGFDEEALRVDECAQILEKDGHPMDLVRESIPKIKAVVARLWESKHPTLVSISRKLQKAARTISQSANKLLTETQPIDDEDRRS